MLNKTTIFVLDEKFNEKQSLFEYLTAVTRNSKHISVQKVDMVGFYMKTCESSFGDEKIFFGPNEAEEMFKSRTLTKILKKFKKPPVLFLERGIISESIQKTLEENSVEILKTESLIDNFNLDTVLKVA